MPNISLPSLRTILADIPEIKNFNSKFVYNFFEPDEKLNDSGITAPQFVRERSSETFDSAFINSNKLNRFTSRYVKLEWLPIVELNQYAPKNIKISDNLNKVYSEQDFAPESFIPIYLQDNGINTKLNFAIKKLIEYQKNINQIKNNIESPLDASKIASQRLSKQIDNSLIKESLINLEEEGYEFFNNQNKKITEYSLIEDLKNVRQKIQLNTKFADIMLQSTEDSSFNIYENNEKNIIENVKKLQDSYNSSLNPNIIDSQDYDFEILEYLDAKPIDLNGNEPRWQIIGYIIDRFEIINGNKNKLDPIIIENPNISTVIDYKIKYGATYQYTIRSVAYLETQAEDVENHEMLLVSYLISSQESKYQLITTIEKTPPPPPADLNARWDNNKRNIIIEWNFPINSQRDIKQWQIFRRNNISEAFELQKVYNFDDSIIKSTDGFSETPNPQYVEIVTNPKNYYIDTEFDKNKKYIYSVCSVDAHGYSSNYSIQIECSFDKYNNQLIKKMISPSGAPKAYPNINLLADTFVDSIRDSNHSKLNIYFNPEYLKVTNGQGNDLELLKTDKNYIYSLNLINIDLQEQKTINIKLLDKRTTGTPYHVDSVEIKPSPKKLKI